jgi:NADH:ubiquinone oxidoreductase subunit K
VLTLALAFLLLALGIWCLLSRRRVIKQVIGLSIMLQGALLILADASSTLKQLQVGQGLIISALVVEAIVFAIALALIVNVFRHHPEGRVDDLDQLRG